MMPPNERVLKEAARLKGGGLDDYLKQCREDALERLAHATENEFRSIQGEAEAYRQLIRMIDGARPDLEKISNRHDMSHAF